MSDTKSNESQVSLTSFVSLVSFVVKSWHYLNHAEFGARRCFRHNAGGAPTVDSAIEIQGKHLKL